MQHGVTCDFKEITEEVRAHNMELTLSRGNHTSSTNDLEIFENLVACDIKVGGQVPIPISLVKKIKHGVVAPFGIANQLSINELGERIDKYWITRDQSFDFQRTIQ